MEKKRGWVVVAVTLLALFLLPLYLMVAIMTAPIGIGIFMMMDGGWIMNLYPFLFAGKGFWNQPVYR